MSVSASFTLPRRSSTLDTTRRRAPPSPLVLGAACQRKVLRSYEKYPEPNLPGVDLFITRDSSCDRVIRGESAHYNHSRKQATLDLEWLGRRINHRTSLSSVSHDSLQVPQVSHDVAEVESRIKIAVTPPRTFDGIYGDTYIEVNNSRVPSITISDRSHSRHSSIDSSVSNASSNAILDAQPIALPPTCLLG